MEKVKCSKCNTENEPGYQFCQTCGAPLTFVSDKTVAAKRSTPETAATNMVQPPPPPAPMPPAGAPTPPPPGSYMQGQMPPQPAYGQPPAYGYPPTPMYAGTPIKQLGLHVDGWSDIVEDGADLADKVKQSFIDKIIKENVPGLRITDVLLSANDMQPRPYILLTNASGVVVPVRVAPYGKNLVVSWDLYTKRSANWLTIGLLGGIVLLLAILDKIIVMYAFDNFFIGLFSFIGTFLSWLLLPTLVLLLLGKIFKDDWAGLFVKNINAFAADDADSLTTIVDNDLVDAIEDCLEPPVPEPTPAPAPKKPKK